MWEEPRSQGLKRAVGKLEESLQSLRGQDHLTATRSVTNGAGGSTDRNRWWISILVSGDGLGPLLVSRVSSQEEELDIENKDNLASLSLSSNVTTFREQWMLLDSYPSNLQKVSLLASSNSEAYSEGNSGKVVSPQPNPVDNK